MKKIIKIGRSKNNDCVFDNPSVSSVHAVLTISEDGQTAVLRDLASTNGTFVNDKRLQSEVTVSKTDRIRFGSEQTSLAEILSRMSRTVVRSSNTPSRGLTIGKSPDNRIVMNHDDVSRRHAVLYKDTNGDIVIEDSNSTNGTYVNGTKITSTVLRPGDKVTITRNYPLNWENYFQAQPVVQQRRKKGRPVKMLYIMAVCVVALLVAGAVFLLHSNRTLDKQEIFDKYNKAVCMVVTEWGYRVLIDGDDVTTDLFGVPYVNVKNGELVQGKRQATGTAFFISDDGKLGTNLHITRPWLYENSGEQLEQAVNKFLAEQSVSNPYLSRSKVEVEGVNLGLYVVLNGLPLTQGNLIECVEYNGGDDARKDVAIMQTETRSLPASDINIIDITASVDDETAYKEGKTVYTIGFPYGTDIAIDSNNDIRNQIHSGSVTQNKGEFEFSHDAETAGGASGSPILDDKGRLIGVHHAGMTGVTGAQGFNWGIKVKWLKELLKN